MKSNLTLIGMPGSGKSTIGVILAKNLGLGFIDTDVLIQINRQKPLQKIIDEHDHLYLRAVEEEEILKINITNHVIATGGSVAYSEKAMSHLLAISKVIFLDVNFEEIKKAAGDVFGRDHVLMRHASLYFSHKYSGKTLKEIGDHFGIGESGVSQASRRLSLKLNEDRNLRKNVRLIEKKLGLSRM